MKTKYIGAGLLILLLICVFPDWVEAQCSVCRGAAEKGLEKTSEGQALNNGILYLMFIPYLLLGSLFLVWWKFWRKPKTGH